MHLQDQICLICSSNLSGFTLLHAELHYCLEFSWQLCNMINFAHIDNVSIIDKDDSFFFTHVLCLAYYHKLKVRDVISACSQTMKTKTQVCWH